MLLLRLLELCNNNNNGCIILIAPLFSENHLKGVLQFVYFLTKLFKLASN